jgi:hypothetical protein
MARCRTCGQDTTVGPVAPGITVHLPGCGEVAKLIAPVPQRTGIRLGRAAAVSAPPSAAATAAREDQPAPPPRVRRTRRAAPPARSHQEPLRHRLVVPADEITAMAVKPSAPRACPHCGGDHPPSRRTLACLRAQASAAAGAE